MTKILSEKAKENLRRNQLLRNKASMYVTLEDGEEVVLKFEPEDIETMYVQFDGNSKKKLRFQYIVTDKYGDKKKLVVCKKTSKEIDRYLENGINMLRIKRIGTGLGTTYQVESAE
jgi:hypothetical protein